MAKNRHAVTLTACRFFAVELRRKSSEKKKKRRIFSEEVRALYRPSLEQFKNTRKVWQSCDKTFKKLRKTLYYSVNKRAALFLYGIIITNIRMFCK